MCCRCGVGRIAKPAEKSCIYFLDVYEYICFMFLQGASAGSAVADELVRRRSQFAV